MTKKKFELNSSLIPICFSNNPKSFPLKKMPKIPSYWKKKHTIERANNQNKSVNYKNNGDILIRYPLSPKILKKERRLSLIHSPIFFLPQINASRLTISKRF